MHIPGNPPGSGLERVLLDKRSGFYAVLGTEPPEPVKIPLIDDGRLSESVPKNTSSRYCPECLASGFGWSTLWQQPWTFACPHHHIALIATCPSCGQRPWSSSSWGGRLAGQACCTEREPRPKGGTSQRSIRPWCNGNLGDAAQIAVHDAALHAQQRLLVLVDAAHRDPGGPRSLGPWSATASQHLHTFCALLRLSVAQARSASSWADHLARASAAFDDLNQTDGSGPTINLMLSDHQTTGLLGPRSQALRSDLGPILVAAGIRNIASAIPPSSRLTFRTARAWAAHPPEWTSPRDHGQHILQEHQTEPLLPPASWVPQSLWTIALRAHDVQEDDGPVLSMILLRLGRTTPWSHIALELGLPATFQRSAGTRLRSLHHHRWPNVLQDMEDLFTQLRQAPPPINYSARRRAAHSVAELAKVVGAHRDDDLAGLRRFWEVFTGGDIRLAPHPLGTPGGTSAHLEHVAQRQHLDDAHDVLFRQYHERLIGHHGNTVDGPLTWTPP